MFIGFLSLSFIEIDGDNKVSEVSIITCDFDVGPRFNIDTNNIVKLNKCFKRALFNKDAVDFESKIMDILKNDTLGGGKYDINSINLRLLVTFKYSVNFPLQYVGINGNGTMYVNGRIYKRSEKLLNEILKQISDKQAQKDIKRAIKRWNKSEKK